MFEWRNCWHNMGRKCQQSRFLDFWFECLNSFKGDRGNLSSRFKLGWEEEAFSITLYKLLNKLSKNYLDELLMAFYKAYKISQIFFQQAFESLFKRDLFWLSEKACTNFVSYSALNESQMLQIHEQIMLFWLVSNTASGKTVHRRKREG